MINKNRECKICFKKLKKGFKCSHCIAKARYEKMTKFVYSIVGYSCWNCGYTKGERCTSVLEFHHIIPEDKIFGLSKREYSNYNWKLVWVEMQKCCVLCANCHREVEFFATEEEIELVEQKYNKKWEEIHNKIKSGEINAIPDSPGYRTPKINHCECGKIIYRDSKKCVVCQGNSTRKVIRPKKEILEEEIKNIPMTTLGKKYGVSDNAIRKWARSYGILLKQPISGEIV